MTSLRKNRRANLTRPLILGAISSFAIRAVWQKCNSALDRRRDGRFTAIRTECHGRIIKEVY